MNFTFFRLFILSLIFQMNSFATQNTPVDTPQNFTPEPPKVSSKAFVIMDANSGKILAQKN